MRTEGFRKQIGKLLFVMGALVVCQPVSAQRALSLFPISESGGIHPVSMSAASQNSQLLSTIRISPLTPLKTTGIIAAERPSRKSWLALSAFEHSAAAFDAYSTRDAIAHGAVEDDPLLRPFARSPAIYAANQVGPLILDYVARRMQRSSHRVVRRMWWLPQTAATAEFIYFGVHNLHVANQP